MQGIIPPLTCRVREKLRNLQFSRP